MRTLAIALLVLGLATFALSAFQIVVGVKTERLRRRVRKPLV